MRKGATSNPGFIPKQIIVTDLRTTYLAIDLKKKITCNDVLRWITFHCRFRHQMLQPDRQHFLARCGQETQAHGQ